MTSRLNRVFGLSLSACLILGGCGGQGGSSFNLNGVAGAAEVPSAGLASAYLSGRTALESGSIGDAAEQFELALVADPDNSELRGQLFDLHLARGAFDEALDVARFLAESETKPDDAALLLAFEAFSRADFERTASLFDQVANQGINALVMPFLKAWLAFAQNEPTQALEILTGDAGANGLSIVRDYHLSAMLQLDGDPNQALDLLSASIPEGEPVPTRLMMQRVSAAQSAELAAEVLEFLAVQAEVDGGNIIRETVQDRVEQGLTIEPPINSAADGMADALLSLARALADQRGTGQALLMGQLARYLTSRMADTSIFTGELLLRDSRTELSQELLEQVIDDPIFGYEAQLLNASALRQLERYDEAASQLESLAQRRSNRTDALIALGNLYSGNRDYAQAADALTRAVDRLDEPQPADWRLFYSRGIAYERTERWPLAETDFLQALELFPDQPFVLNYLGYSWVDQGLNLDEAKDMLRLAVELRPEDGFIVDSLGWAHFRLGEFDDAVVHLERAVELEPGDPVINDHLGDAYWRVGREREARYQWERALLFEPDNDVLTAVQDKLQNGLAAVADPG